MIPTNAPPHADTQNITKLIVVCCHAIWLGGPTNGLDESEWAISTFQHGETGTFAAHAELGITELIKANGSGLLVFSGGATKRSRTPVSEAESYHSLVRARRSLPAEHEHLEALVHEERYAVDSFQNLLLSLLLFCRVVGRAPVEIVLVTHAFKRERFLEIHCPTICWDPGRIVFRGLDPEWGEDEDGLRKRRDTEMGEERTRMQWREDPWGWTSLLGQKRVDRGWTLVEGVHDVVLWDGGESRMEAYPGVLPWT